MSIRIQINIKGASKKINTLEYEYSFDDGDYISIGDFLDETVEITYKRYMETVADNKNVETGNPDFIPDRTDMIVSLLKVLSKEEIEEMAEQGKVGFGVHYNTNNTSLIKAKSSARQCFMDGIVALFIGDERYENPEDKVAIYDGEQVTFVKLTFLAGRMW